MIDEAKVRAEKLEKLRARGNPYPSDTRRDTKTGEAITHFDQWSAQEKDMVLAGRLLTTRIHGGMIFADLVDETGKIQIALKEDQLEKEVFESFRDLVDPADIIEVKGILFQTKRGERTLQVKEWRMLSKALLPLPEKWHGLQDVEIRYRERELDLISNPEVKQRFLIRSRLVSELRRFLDGRNFLEVETPMLQPIPGGANARPFVTHHNALDVDLYLRIAPELYLKRLLVGGFEKIYEIARCFRNEGIDYSHNPEFTQIELYWAFSDKEIFLSFIEELLTTVVRQVFGTLEIQHERGPINISAPWPRTTFREAVLDACGIDVNLMKSPEDVEAAAKKAGLSIDFSKCIGIDEHLDELYKKTARAKITGPMWIMDYPVQMIPLAGRSPDDASKSATAQLVIHGTEVIKAFYHELHDPVEQRTRLEEQQALIEKGSEEAQRLDEDFLRALEHGMPPASGLGMGIDRLCALLTNSPNLKEVILFPTLRPAPSDLKPSA
jgi:lysyl-tRNA synthetase, class II